MKIAIVGHGPEDFGGREPPELKSTIKQIVDDHGKSVLLLFNGDIGIPQWACIEAIRLEIQYGLYVPCMPDEMGKYWYIEQMEELQKQYLGASEIFIGNPHSSLDSLELSDFEYRNQMMVDGANFVVAFWNNKKIGSTYNTINMAVNRDKIVLNALNNMKIISKKDLYR